MKFKFAIILLPLIVFSGLLGVLIGSKPLMKCEQISFSSDTMLYLVMTQRAGMGETSGDTFLYEHRNSGAISSVNKDWISFLGKIHSAFDFKGVLFLLLPFYTLWIWSLCRIYGCFGIPKGFSFFLSVLLVNVIVGIAGGFQGMHNLIWITVFPWQDYWRIYPTTISMSIYCFAVSMVFSLWRAQWKTFTASVMAGIVCGMVIFGRPFDALVLFTFLGLLLGLVIWNKDTPRKFNMAVVIGVAVAVCSIYVWRYLSVIPLNRDLFDDILGRGNIQMKAFSHYLKYGGCMTLVLGVLFFLYHQSNHREGTSESLPLNLLLLLTAAAFLPHFLSMPTGKTIVGFGYYFHPSMVPWSFLALSVLLYHQKRFSFFEKNHFWLIAALVLAALDAGWMSHQARSLLKTDSLREERLSIYPKLAQDQSYTRDSVVLSFDSTNELMMNVPCYTFLPTSLNQTYIVNAPTDELLARYLYVSKIVRGHFGFLSNQIVCDGVTLSDLQAKLSVEDALWLNLLRNALGSNSFVFHPKLNELDLKAKGIVLPDSLSGKNELVIYFNSKLQKKFVEINAQWADGNDRASSIPYRLDYLIIPKVVGGEGLKDHFRLILETANYRVFGRIK